MNARALLITLALGLLTAPLIAEAQQPTNVYRIGRLNPGPSIEPNPGLAAFRQGLRALGYVEGQNLVIEDRHAEGNPERLRDLATELVRLKVDVIVAGGGAGIRAAQRATQTIPIVMAVTGDAVRDGFVASLAHPGGNITGLSWLAEELPDKRLELLKETVPQSARVAVLAHPATPGGAETARRRLPTMYYWKSSVEAGGLMAYGPSLPDMQWRAATYVDKILQGATPADLPVEQPMKFELVIHLTTAQALGLTISPTFLFQADEVIP